MSFARLRRRPPRPYGFPCGGRGLVLLALALQLGCSPSPSPSPTLRPGKTQERTIAEKESHSYTVQLAAGDFLRVAVDQEGVDVEVKLSGPDGRQVALVDGPGPAGDYGTEDLAAIVAASGPYQIMVRATVKNAPQARYRIRLEAPHPAREDDRRRVEAAQADQDATDEMVAKRPHAGQARLREKALRLWHDLGETHREADTLLQLGLVLSNPGETEQASRLFHQAAGLYEKLGDPVEQAKALNEAGRAGEKLGHEDEALREYRQAEALAHNAGARWPEVNALTNIGFFLNSQGEPKQAVATLQKALGLATGLQCGGCQGPILVNLGSAYDDLFEIQSAIGSYKQALAVPHIQEEDSAAALNNLGLAYLSLGNSEEALDDFKKVDGKNPDNPSTLSNIGVALMRMGRFSEALGFYDKALEAAQQTGDLKVQVSTLHSIGYLDLKTGKKAAALAAWEKMGELAKGRQDLAPLRLYTQALAQRERGDLAAAERDLEGSLRLAHARGDLGRESAALLELGRVEKLRGRSEPALSHLKSGVGIIESLRSRVLSADLRALYLGSKQAFYDLYIDTLMDLHREKPQAGWDAQALQISERARARSLLDLLCEIRTDRRQGAQPQPLDAAAIQRQVLGEGALLLEYSLGDEQSYLWAVSPTAVHSFTLPGRARIEQAARDFYDLVMRQDADPAAADRAARALSRLLLTPVEGLLGDNTLLVVSDGVLQYVPFSALPLPSAPQERLLVRHRIVSLPSASTLAVLRQEIHGRPPAPRTLAILADPVFRQEDSRIAQGRHAPEAVATKRGPDAELEDLPWSKEEAEAIAGMVPEAGQKLEALGVDASVASATGGRLAGYRYVHFATHGLLDTSHPERSGLALSRFDRNGARQEGFLSLQDIYNLQLHADLVVLSACRTALGKEVRREGLIGLTRGFMYAGAARVLASLWSVEDRATSKLMAKLYRHLLVEKMPPAEALRRAQLDLAKDPRWSSPYYWAGFSLQGEWR